MSVPARSKLEKQIDAAEWCGRALQCLMTFWRDGPLGGAWRDSESEDSHRFYPTATLRTILAIDDCYWTNQFDTLPDGWERVISSGNGIVGASMPFPGQVLEVILRLVPSSKYDVSALPSSDRCPAWVQAILSESDFSSEEIKSAANPHETRRVVVDPEPRDVILIGSLLDVLNRLMRRCRHQLAGDSRQSVLQGVAYLMHRLFTCFTDSQADDGPRNKSQQNPSLSMIVCKLSFRRHPGHTLLNFAIALDAIQDIQSEYSDEFKNAVISLYRTDHPSETDAAETYGKIVARLAAVRKQLVARTERDMNYIMARRHIPTDPHYDPAGLICSAAAHAMLQPEFRHEALLVGVVDAAAKQGIGDDGTWPVGWSEPTGGSNLIQQVSSETSHALADLLVVAGMRLSYPHESSYLLELAMPALSKHAAYLVRTYKSRAGSSSGSTRRYHEGWSTDRIRYGASFTEAWVTSFSARFFNKFKLLELTQSRQRILRSFNARSCRTSRTMLRPWTHNEWWDQICEQDYVLQPMKQVYEEFVKPIADSIDQKGGHSCGRLRKPSFIIYGPPGSGKTFFVSCISRALGWPLIELTPGHFIRQGAEAIEATSGRIFSRLERLEHAVVFFDECDGLFANRNSRDDASQRNIWSFVTASMLPKLQRLHDRGNVVFVLATNYLHNIDSAIRRPGRFDYRILCDRMDDTARMFYIADYLRHRSRGNKDLPAELQGIARKLSDESVKSKWIDLRRSQAAGSEAALQALRSTFGEQDTERLRALSMQCNGFLVPGIQRLCEAPDRREEFVRASGVEDWLDWWREHGEEELRAAAMPDTVRTAVWHRLDAAAKQYRQRAVSGSSAKKTRASGVRPR